MTATAVLAALAIAPYDSLQAQADARTKSLCDELGTAGAAVAVYAGDKLVYARGRGWENRAKKRPATERTVFRLGSISKSVTAVAAMGLVEEKRLDLDADIRRWATAFPAKEWPVSARQIMGHTSGIRHYAPGEGAVFDHFPSASAAMARFASDPLLFQPGTRYSYSTHAWTVLAAAMEKLDALSFPELMKRRVFRKVGGSMECEDARQPKPNRSELYTLRGTEIVDAGRREDNSWKYAGGGLEADAPTLAKFGNDLLRGRLLEKSSVEAMWTPQKLATGEATGYGIGFSIGMRGIGHNGAQQGCRTSLLIDRDKVIVVAVLANTGGSRDQGPVIRDLMALWAPAAQGAEARTRGPFGEGPAFRSR